MIEQLQPLLCSSLKHSGRQRPLRVQGSLVELTGGWESSLYSFALDGDHEDEGQVTSAVLKLYRPNERGREHARREWRALEHLRSAGRPVPRGILLETDDSHLGRPFIIMERLPGASFWEVFESADPGRRALLTQAYVGQLVELHTLDPSGLDPAARSTPSEWYLTREVEQLQRDAALSPHRELTEVSQWLSDHQPVPVCEPPAIIHRDYHPWNVLIDGSDGLWVLDWDWGIGDGCFDLAWTCTMLRRSGHSAFSAAVSAEYARQSGRPLDHLSYFEVLTTLRWLLNVLPAVDTSDPLDAQMQTRFRAFVADPVHRARVFLQQSTGIAGLTS